MHRFRASTNPVIPRRWPHLSFANAFHLFFSAISFRKRHRSAFLFACMFVLPPLDQSNASEIDAIKALNIARQAYFHIIVSGTNSTSEKIIRHGKAFAITSSVLLTAEHVIGRAEEWKEASGIVEELSVAILPLDRKIEVFGALPVTPSSLPSPIALSSPVFGVDAGALFSPGFQIPSHFNVTLCSLVSGQEYWAVMSVGGLPASVESLRNVGLVKLRAVGYDTPNYGPLFILEPADSNLPFKPDVSGHEGSPVLDSEGNVIAIISAVTTFGANTGYRILATPIRSTYAEAFSAFGPDGTDVRALRSNMKCSLSEKVDQINNLVTKHAIWNITVGRESDGRPKNRLILEYDNPADPPNIKSIRVEYQFWGLPRKNADETRMQVHDFDQEYFDLEQDSKNARLFSDEQIVKLAKTILEPKLAKSEGSILYVKLTISPTLDTGETIEGSTKKIVYWREDR